MLTKRDIPTLASGLLAALALIAAKQFPDARLAFFVLAMLLVAGGLWLELVFLPRRDLQTTSSGIALIGRSRTQSAEWPDVKAVALLRIDGEYEWHLKLQSGGLLTIMEHEVALRSKLIKAMSLYLPTFSREAVRHAIAAQQDWAWHRVQGGAQPGIQPDGPASGGSAG